MVNSPRSPDDSSPVYPHRPIRPLPRRRIRSRLSVEEAEAISFPPVSTVASPSFGSPLNAADRAAILPHYPNTRLHGEHDDVHSHICDCGEEHPLDSDEEEQLEREVDSGRQTWRQGYTTYPRELAQRMPQRAKSSQPTSSTSSADGYESFENTNNKKKRKIPVPGTLGDTSPIDGTSMSIPTQSIDVSVPDRAYNQYYPPSAYNPGVGISGAGRGRNSRAARYSNEKRPLGTSINGVNTVSSGKSYPETVSRTSVRFDYGLRRSLTYPLDHAEQQGIISAAIANAAEKGPLGGPKGQENVSLLQREPSGSTGAKDFTFEYPSGFASDMANGLHPGKPAVSSQATQTHMPPRTSNKSYPPPPQGSQYPPGQQAAPAPRPRRPGHALRMAAARRKEQQFWKNTQEKPTRDNLYICEFCEYESIYGRPPTALIRQYELKDRRERKAKELNRRRLEKMKARGRKNRKGFKGNKNPPATPSDLHQQPYDSQYDPPDGDSGGEDFFEDGYDDSVPLPPHLDPMADGHLRDPGKGIPYDDYNYPSRNYPPPLDVNRGQASRASR